MEEPGLSQNDVLERWTKNDQMLNKKRNEKRLNKRLRTTQVRNYAALKDIYAKAEEFKELAGMLKHARYGHSCDKITS